MERGRPEDRPRIEWKRAVSRVLYPPLPCGYGVVVTIYLGRPLPDASRGLPEGRAGRPISLLFDLTPDGVYQASRSPGCW